MTDSILTSIKAPLGLIDDVTAFDAELIMHINAVLGDINQLGIGPPTGFRITDDSAVWTDLIGTELRYEGVKDYMATAVKLRFNPPTIGFVLNAMIAEKEKMEWRLNRQREDIVNPLPPPGAPARDDMGDPVTVDGGEWDG